MMATRIGTNKIQCIKCGKERATSKCAGCGQDFCYKHLTEHRQELSIELDQIEVERDILQETFNQSKTDPIKHSLIEEINQWEFDSIQKIQMTADKCRQILVEHTDQYNNNIEMNLTKLTDQMRQLRQEEDFNEMDLFELQQKLIYFTEQLNRPPHLSIKHHSSTFINQISLIQSSCDVSGISLIDQNTKWQQNGITIAGGNSQGNKLNQLFHPYGISIDDNDQCIYIADWRNHRIVEWIFGAEQGRIVAGGNGEGDRLDQLNCPRDVILDKKNDSIIISDQQNNRVVLWPRQNGTNGKIIISNLNCSRLANDNNGDIYVSDWNKDEVRRWRIGQANGEIVAGGNGKGNQLNQLNTPTYIFVDQYYSVYVTDRQNHRIMKWTKGAKEGIIVAGGYGKGNSLTQLSDPQGIIVDHLGNIYVADSNDHRIMRWSPGSKQGTIVIGGNGCGQQPNQFNHLGDVSFDREGNLYVIDYNNHRLQKFQIGLN